jgi:hypothetical protein
MDTLSKHRRAKRDGTALREMITARRRRQRASARHGPAPTVFEAVTRQMVEALTAEVRDVKSRVNQLLSVIIGAILLEVLSRLIGA